jgi:ribose transport system substrate-binding protein
MRSPSTLRTPIPRNLTKATPLLAAALAVGAFAGCGSSDSSTSSSSGAADKPAAAKVDTAGAKAILAPFTGKPSAFPVDEPLKKSVKGKTFDYLQCVTPVCGVFATILPGAAQALGVKLESVKAGASADALQNAMNSIITKAPAAVVLPAVEPDLINVQLKELKTKGIPAVSNGIMNHEKYGISAAMFNTQTAEISGQLLAAKAITDKGADANIVLYTTPELSFGPVIKNSFTQQIGKLCASCKVRYVDIPVATIGNQAPSRVVSDLQANPKTNIAVFTTMEASNGLPSALKTAGLSPLVSGFGPNPAAIQDLKAGKLHAAVGLDLAVMLWTQMDAAARLSTGQELTAGEKKGLPPIQVVEAADIKTDPAKGYSAYPDFPARFGKLWAAAK